MNVVSLHTISKGFTFQDSLAVKSPLRLFGTRHECRQVKVSEKEIALGPTEYKLLHFLVSHPMRVHSRQQLRNHVWGDTAELQDRTVDAYIGRLRSLIHATGHHPCIETVRSTGYRFIKRTEALVNARTGQDRRQADRRATPRNLDNG